MLIFVKCKLVLFLMPKCASTALEESFGKHSEFVIGGSPRLKHLPLKVYERYVQRLLSRRLGQKDVFERFCLFREPLDWLFSWYRYRTRGEMRENDRSARDVSFTQFLNEHFSAQPSKFARLRLQSTYIESTEGRHDAVTLYRYEDVEALVAEFESRLRKRIAWTHANVSPHAAFDLTPQDVREAQDKLRLEYSIYEKIPVRHPL